MTISGVNRSSRLSGMKIVELDQSRLMVTRAEMAAALGVSPVTILKWHMAGRIPAPVRMGRVLRWPRAVLDRLMSEGVAPASGEGAASRG